MKKLTVYIILVLAVLLMGNVQVCAADWEIVLDDGIAPMVLVSGSAFIPVVSAAKYLDNFSNCAATEPGWPLTRLSSYVPVGSMVPAPSIIFDTWGNYMEVGGEPDEDALVLNAQIDMSLSGYPIYSLTAQNGVPVHVFAVTNIGIDYVGGHIGILGEPIPEPTSLIMFGLAGLGMAVKRFRK